LLIQIVGEKKKKKNFTEVAAFIVDTLLEPLPVLFHDPAGHFGWNGSNFFGYRLLKNFQSLGTTLVYLGFEVAPEKKIARRQIWRSRRPPDVTMQRDNMPRKHFSENSERATSCAILLKPHIFCSMSIEKFIQFRPEKVV
jgi:hypothetical protein